MGGDGKKFIDHHATKGCHAVGGFAYYGIEQTKKNPHRTSLVLPFSRPNGYDCGIKHNKILINSLKMFIN